MRREHPNHRSLHRDYGGYIRFDQAFTSNSDLTINSCNAKTSSSDNVAAPGSGAFVSIALAVSLSRPPAGAGRTTGEMGWIGWIGWMG